MTSGGIPLLAMAMLVAALLARAAPAAGSSPAAAVRLAARGLAFEPNRGQAGAAGSFVARARDYDVLLGAAGPVVATHDGQRVVRMRFEQANPRAALEGVDALPGRVSYLRGRDRARWLHDLPTFAGVRHTGVYPGIDVLYRGRAGALEYDFVVAPGADPSAIALRPTGADDVSVDAAGALQMRIGARWLRQTLPRIYEMGSDGEHVLAGRFRTRADGAIGIEIAARDASRRLVVDPVIEVSTYLGGSGDDFGGGIAVGGDGAIYVTGWTNSLDFPVSAGAFDATIEQPAPPEIGRDAFVAKLDPTGQSLEWATYLGGSSTEFEVVYAAVDANGHVFVSGATKSSDFPVTAGAFQPDLHGEVDGFVAKLLPDGSDLVYATYLGGTGLETPQTVAIDADGDAYVTGVTGSSDFPTTPGSFQPNWGGNADAFVAKLAPDGSSLVWATYLGGSADEPAPAAPGLFVDAARRVFVAGTTLSDDFPTTADAVQPARSGPPGSADAFVALLDPSGADLLYGSYLGGSGNEEGRSVVLDSLGRIALLGITDSADFPTTPGAYQPTLAGGTDVFVARLSPGNPTPHSVTLLGGTSQDLSRHMVELGDGSLAVTGSTLSSDFPATPGAPQQAWAGNEDAFVSIVGADGDALAFSTFLGGTGNDRARGMALGPMGRIHVVGFTGSTDFPTAHALQPDFAGGGVESCFFAGGCDAFVTRIGLPEPGAGALAAAALAALGAAARGRARAMPSARRCARTPRCG